MIVWTNGTAQAVAHRSAPVHIETENPFAALGSSDSDDDPPIPQQQPKKTKTGEFAAQDIPCSQPMEEEKSHSPSQASTKQQSQEPTRSDHRGPADRPVEARASSFARDKRRPEKPNEPAASQASGEILEVMGDKISTYFDSYPGQYRTAGQAELSGHFSSLSEAKRQIVQNFISATSWDRGTFQSKLVCISGAHKDHLSSPFFIKEIVEVVTGASFVLDEQRFR